MLRLVPQPKHLCFLCPFFILTSQSYRLFADKSKIAVCPAVGQHLGQVFFLDFLGFLGFSRKFFPNLVLKLGSVGLARS